MNYLKRSALFSIVLLVMMIVAACGSSTTGTGGTPTSGNTPAPAATTPSSSSSLVNTATATVKGASTMILTDAKGLTLYYFTADSATKSACTGSCAQNWPPLLSTGSGTSTSTATLPGTLSVVTTANGNQVTYNGHLLYTFSGDSAPGQTNGEGLFGKWFVCTPTLAAGSGSTALINTATASVKGTSETILTNAKGLTLYYFTADSATKSACTGSCAQNWPPLLMTGSGTPTGATALPGKLTIVTTGNGTQVEYDGHLLYTFAGDSAAGQTNGQGLFGKWFVATPKL